jgi:hypothetical protein
MGFFSRFKKKEKKVDPVQLIESTFDSVFNKLLDELSSETYCWDKPFGVKKYDSFILSKFVIEYSFRTLYAEDVDKDVSEGFDKIFSTYFINQHDIVFNGMLKFEEMESVINEKVDKFNELRRESRPPECWYNVYSNFTGNISLEETNAEIESQQNGLELVKGNPGFSNLVPKCEAKLAQTIKLSEAFISAEVAFPRVIRFTKSEFKKMNLKKIKAAIKKIEKAEKKKEKSKK